MKKKIPINQSFQRLDNKPLDETMVFDTLIQAQDYAKNNPTAYEGQIVHVKDARTPLEINDGEFIYEETYYIDVLKNVVPICSFTYETMGMFFDLMYEILNGPTEETRNKLDILTKIMYKDYIPPELIKAPYYTQPWDQSLYNDYQICLKMSEQFTGNSLGGVNTITIKGTEATYENIKINSDVSPSGMDEYYKVITFNDEQLPEQISFDGGSSIEKVIHMCDTSKITRMTSMFSGCSALTELDVSGWDTSNVVNMTAMFNGCAALTSLDLSNFNTAKVGYMDQMFQGCESLTSLDLSSWNTSILRGMSYMFNNCISLTSLDVSNWITSRAVNMQSMFDGCVSLTVLDLSSCNTSKVTNMAQMFRNCSALTQLDISNWDMYNILDRNDMFKNCSSSTFDNIIMTNCSDYTLRVIKSQYDYDKATGGW